MSEVAKTFKLGGELEIHRLGYGAMRITGEGIWGEPKDREGAKKVLHRAVELGVDFIDTADSYGPAVSERLIGEALAPYSKGTIIATKAGPDAARSQSMAAGGTAGVSDATGGDEPALVEERTARSVAASSD